MSPFLGLLYILVKNTLRKNNLRIQIFYKSRNTLIAKIKLKKNYFTLAYELRNWGTFKKFSTFFQTSAANFMPPNFSWDLIDLWSIPNLRTSAQYLSKFFRFPPILFSLLIFHISFPAKNMCKKHRFEGNIPIHVRYPTVSPVSPPPGGFPGQILKSVELKKIQKT